MNNKNIFKIGIFAFAMAFGLVACDDPTTGLVETIYYPAFTLNGGTTYTAAIGTYEEPGYMVTVNGEDVSNDVVVKGSVDAATPGIYKVYYSYTAINTTSDGTKIESPVSATRTVLIYDPAVTEDLSGSYLTQAGSGRFYNGSLIEYTGAEINITQLAPGIFAVSDLIAGWYEQRAGYGASYAMTGYIMLNADNSLTCLQGHVKGWNDDFESFEGSYNPATGEISWVTEYTDYPFYFYTYLQK